MSSGLSTTCMSPHRRSGNSTHKNKLLLLPWFQLPQSVQHPSYVRTQRGYQNNPREQADHRQQHPGRKEPSDDYDPLPPDATTTATVTTKVMLADASLSKANPYFLFFKSSSFRLGSVAVADMGDPLAVVALFKSVIMIIIPTATATATANDKHDGASGSQIFFSAEGGSRAKA